MVVKISSSVLMAAITLTSYALVVEASKSTRFWDCCKLSGSWAGKAPVYNPVDVCKADGMTLIDPKEAESGQSGCNGGDQFMCSCLQPYNDEVDPTLAYAFAAFSGSQSEQESECACYQAHFKPGNDGSLKTTKMIFQVVSTGDSASGNVDLAIPGGGFGQFTAGCKAQFPETSASQWGANQGGVSSAGQCSNLPKGLQSGCKWRFSNWGDNPVLVEAPKRVQCPMGLIDRSGCQRKDEANIPAYSGKTDSKGVAPKAQYKRDRSVCSAGSSGSGANTPKQAPGAAVGGGATVGGGAGSGDGADDENTAQRGYGSKDGSGTRGGDDASNTLPSLIDYGIKPKRTLPQDKMNKICLRKRH